MLVNTEIISSLHWFFKFLTAHTGQPQGELTVPHHPYHFSTFDPDPTQFSNVGPREIQKLVLRLLFSLLLSENANFCLYNAIIYAQQGNIIKKWENQTNTDQNKFNGQQKIDLKAKFVEETFKKTMLLVFQYQ